MVRLTHLGIPVSDERDQLVVLNLESLIKHLRDQEAAGWLAVDDTAAVELLEYLEEHLGGGGDVVAGVGGLAVQLGVPSTVELNIEGEDVLRLQSVEVEVGRGNEDQVPAETRRTVNTMVYQDQKCNLTHL